MKTCKIKHEKEKEICFVRIAEKSYRVMQNFAQDAEPGLQKREH